MSVLTVLSLVNSLHPLTSQPNHLKQFQDTKLFLCLIRMHVAFIFTARVFKSFQKRFSESNYICSCKQTNTGEEMMNKHKTVFFLSKILFFFLAICLDLKSLCGCF